uniref:U4-Theriditoxin-Lha1a_1 n=1 Tax=Latrodectus hasselti TaxID=256736 RepID=A0A482ZHK8_LATHA
MKFFALRAYIILFQELLLIDITCACVFSWVQRVLTSNKCEDGYKKGNAGNDCSCCEQYDKCDCVWIDGIRNCKCKKVAFEAKWKRI